MHHKCNNKKKPQKSQKTFLGLFNTFKFLKSNKNHDGGKKMLALEGFFTFIEETAAPNHHKKNAKPYEFKERHLIKYKGKCNKKQ